jgi:hypothetical protein
LANVTQVLGRMIANVALTHLRGSLSASLDSISRILTFYIAWRRQSRFFSRSVRWPLWHKRVHPVSRESTLASALCGSVSNLTELVICGAGFYRSHEPHCCRSTSRSGSARRLCDLASECYWTNLQADTKIHQKFSALEIFLSRPPSPTIDQMTDFIGPLNRRRIFSLSPAC